MKEMIIILKKKFFKIWNLNPQPKISCPDGWLAGGQKKNNIRTANANAN